MKGSNDTDWFGDAMELGPSVLAQIVERAQDGVFVCDAERRWVYVNAAACKMLGRSAVNLLGCDYVDFVPDRDKAASRRYWQPRWETEPALLSGSTEMLTRMLVVDDGREREVVFAPVPVDIDGAPHGAGFFRDFTETRAAARTGAALAQNAAGLVGTESVNEILAGIAQQAVKGTRAFWCGLAIVGEDETFAYAGAYGPNGPDFGDSSQASRALRTAPAAAFLAAMTSSTMQVGGAPSRASLLTRSTWERDPLLSTFGKTVLDNDWQIGLCMPLALHYQVTGALMILLPAELSEVSDVEAAFCGALADHAAVAVANERLSHQAARSAELHERRRVARDLHDSVSQALFAITMHARTAQLAMDVAGLDHTTALGRSVTHLARLARGTLAEMRAMIFELRPGALAEEGLIEALRTQGAAVSAREHVDVVINAAVARLQLDANVEEVLYRIVSEALRNVVAHAEADTVTVSITTDPHTLRIMVTDDGVGFEVNAATAGRGGLGAMAQRAQTIGAELRIESRIGTTLWLEVALHADSSEPQQ